MYLLNLLEFFFQILLFDFNYEHTQCKQIKMFSITVYTCIYYDTYIHFLLLEVNPVQNIHAVLNIRFLMQAS